MQKKYLVRLSEDERNQLLSIVKTLKQWSGHLLGRKMQKWVVDPTPSLWAVARPF
jgi:hypothetical protein